MDTDRLLARLLAPTMAEAIHPILHAIRARGTAFRAANGVWFVTGYGAAQSLLRSPALARRIPGHGAPPRPEDDLRVLEPPEHTRVRAGLADAVPARRMYAHRAAVAEIAARRFRWAPGAAIEVVAGAIGPYVGESVRSLLSLAPPVPPGSRHGRLSEREYAINLALLDVAGLETTTVSLANAVQNLLRDPAHLTRLAADPGLIANAAEEALRHESGAVFSSPRVALAPLRVGPGRIERGDRVVVVMAAANRDPAAFPDPDAFLPDRAGPRHVSFGGGPHRCFGAAFARVLIEEAIRRLASVHARSPLLIESARRSGGIAGRVEELVVRTRPDRLPERTPDR